MRRTNSSPDMNTGWLLSLERESKHSTLESSAESDRGEGPENEELLSMQPSVQKQGTFYECKL